MTVFLSYAHQDVELAMALRQDLEDIGQTVWFDENMHGGQIWWDEILRQLRECQLFVLAVSAHSLASEACVAEWEYSAALNRRFLPVRIDETDWTTAPAAMKDSQYIDFRVGDLESTKALARALLNVSDPVPLPEVLPPVPLAPQSYRERFANLFGSGPLTIEDQVSYYVRLSIDVDGANSDEAVALLQVLHARTDLSWKVRQDIEDLIGDRAGKAPPLAPPSAGDAVTLASPIAPVEGAEVDSEGPITPPRSKRLYLIVAAVAAVVVVGAAVALLWPNSDPKTVQQPENTTCSVDTCSETPIRFVDLTGNPDDFEVTMQDPLGYEVEGIDLPTLQVGTKSELEWTWSAGYEDPIGTYTVQFTNGDGDTTEHSFTVESIDGAFGIVQLTAEAISSQDWETAASLDDRIAEELDESGPSFLEEEYPVDDEKHWVPYDASGDHNALGTAIIGAYITYAVDLNKTIAQCEVWAVDTDSGTMRSGPLPRVGDQETQSRTDLHSPSEFSEFISEDCVAAANPNG